MTTLNIAKEFYIGFTNLYFHQQSVRNLFVCALFPLTVAILYVYIGMLCFSHQLFFLFCFTYNTTHDFNFIVGLVLKNACTYSIIFKIRILNISVIWKRFFIPWCNQSLHSKLRAKKCLICFLSLQVKCSFPKEWLSCNHPVCILRYMALSEVQRCWYWFILLPIFLFIAEYHFDVWI